MKLEFDDDGDGGTGENSVAKPKAPRVKKEKKEPGQYQSTIWWGTPCLKEALSLSFLFPVAQELPE